MATCDICGNGFKNNSGLSGHKQLVHRSESGETSALGIASSRLLKPSEQRLLEQFGERLLEQIQPQLERIERASSLIIDQVKVAAIEEVHKHGMSDPECPGCIEVVRESLENERKKVVAYYEAIPGVTQLREIWEEQQAFRRELKARGEDPNQELVTIIPEDEEMAEEIQDLLIAVGVLNG